jgi:ferric-dicitrate binding protein FerR (iron transport regulator)
MAINENERQLAWLYRAFDEGLSPEEQQQLEAALAASESLRAEQQRLQVLRQSLSSLQPEASEAFTDAVMARLNADRANVIPLRWLVQVAAACVLIILLAGLSIYTTEGSLSAEALSGLSELYPEDASVLLADY